MGSLSALLREARRLLEHDVARVLGRHRLDEEDRAFAGFSFAADTRIGHEIPRRSLPWRRGKRRGCYSGSGVTSFFPHIFDSERFLGPEGLEHETSDEKASFLAGCFTDDEHELDWSLNGTEEMDIQSARRHPETGEYLGGMVDAVYAGLPNAGSEAATLLKHASCLHGRLAEVEPAFGYLSFEEVEIVARALQTLKLEVRGLEGDRVLLLRLLDIALEHRAGSR